MIKIIENNLWEWSSKVLGLVEKTPEEIKEFINDYEA